MACGEDKALDQLRPANRQCPLSRMARIAWTVKCMEAFSSETLYVCARSREWPLANNPDCEIYEGVFLGDSLSHPLDPCCCNATRSTMLGHRVCLLPLSVLMVLLEAASMGTRCVHVLQQLHPVLQRTAVPNHNDTYMTALYRSWTRLTSYSYLLLPEG